MTAPLEGLVTVDYRGAAHLLGRTRNAYAIWRLDAGGPPVALFPLSAEGWAEAWDRYRQVEDVDASTPWAAEDPRTLRPMLAGDLVGRAFRVWVRHFRVLVGMAALFVLPVQGLILALSLANMRYVPRTIDGEVIRVPQEPLWVSALSNVVMLVVTAILAGAMVVAVGRALLDRRPTIRDALGSALRRGASLLWVILLEAFAVLAAVVPGVGMIVTARSTGARTVGLVVLLIGAVVAVFLFVRVLLAPAALMVEGRRGVRALERSWSLSRGFGWRILGVMLLIALMVGAIVLLATLLVLPILIRGGTSTDTLLTFFVVLSVLTAIAGAVANPLFHVGSMLLYLDARVRKEGYGVDVLERDLAGA